MQHLKAAVYFSAGIGDALLLTPLIKQLKKEGYHVTGIFTSVFKVHELYDDIKLLDDKIVILSKPKKVWFVGKFFLNKFHLSIVNYFAANKTNLTVASKTSLRVITNRDVVFQKIKLNNVHFIQPQSALHDAQQNLNLINSSHSLNESDFKILSKLKVNFKGSSSPATVSIKQEVSLLFKSTTEKSLKSSTMKPFLNLSFAGSLELGIVLSTIDFSN